MVQSSSFLSRLPPLVFGLGLVLAASLLLSVDFRDKPLYGEFLMESIAVFFWLTLLFLSRQEQQQRQIYLPLVFGTAMSFLGALLDWLDEVLEMSALHPWEDLLQSAGLLVTGYGLLQLFRSQRQQQQLLQKLAGTDPLTGALNRRALSYPSAPGSSIFVLVDVDHFKQINDTLGHDAGDFVLVELARLISGQIRQSDQFFRWGGEEFLLELKDTELDEAFHRIEALRKLIDDSHFNYGGNTIRITISAGIASVIQTQGGLEKAIKAADEALYLAKQAGRNQVLCAQPT